MRRLVSYSLLLLVFSMPFSARASDGQQQGRTESVERDMCGALMFSTAVRDNYVLDCLNLGSISIDKLLKSGYRVTAAAVGPGDSSNMIALRLFVEKATK